MTRRPCSHPDVRKFDGIRSCLACGETVFEAPALTIPLDVQTTDTPTRYQYSHLNYTLGQEIRLVILLPGALHDPIRCEITHVNLEDNPEYDAVSYTWADEDGDDSLSRNINISNGLCFVPVTINCEATLRQLRQPGSRRKLWIDALCIDQSNVSERNHQVGIMDSIYTKASCVRICIQDYLRFPVPIDYADLFSHIKEKTPTESQINQLRHLFSLRYFQRAWVIQEVALARTAYLLVNNYSLLLSATVLENLRSSFKSLDLRVPGPLLWDPEFSGFGTRPKKDIFTCLYATAQSKTTDERDRVYAVLALMEPMARSLIPVDYSLDIVSIYANVLVAIVATQQNLDVIPCIIRRGDTSTAQDIETIMGYVSLYTGYRHYPFNEAGYLQTIEQFEGYQPERWCSSVHVSTAISLDDDTSLPNSGNEKVSTVTFEKSSHPTPYRIIPRFRVRAHFIDIIQDTQVHERYSWRMTPSSVVSGIRDPNSWYRFMLPFFRRAPSSEAPQDLAQGANPEDICTFIEEWSQHRSYTEWLTTRFSVGFARPGLQKLGDEVFAIDGATAPWILRRNREGAYQIIGECYLWAALELDVWNPGTKKGRWGDEDCQQDMGEQTRFIEVQGTVKW